jgi:hypothetical protein
MMANVEDLSRAAKTFKEYEQWLENMKKMYIPPQSSVEYCFKQWSNSFKKTKIDLNGKILAVISYSYAIKWANNRIKLGVSIDLGKQIYSETQEALKQKYKLDLEKTIEVLDLTDPIKTLDRSVYGLPEKK